MKFTKLVFVIAIILIFAGPAKALRRRKSTKRLFDLELKDVEKFIIDLNEFDIYSCKFSEKENRILNQRIADWVEPFNRSIDHPKSGKNQYENEENQKQYRQKLNKKLKDQEGKALEIKEAYKVFEINGGANYLKNPIIGSNKNCENLKSLIDCNWKTNLQENIKKKKKEDEETRKQIEQHFSEVNWGAEYGY